MNGREFKIDFADRWTSAEGLCLPAEYDGYIVIVGIDQEALSDLADREGGIEQAIATIEREMLAEMHRLEQSGETPGGVTRRYPPIES